MSAREALETLPDLSPEGGEARAFGRYVLYAPIARGA